MDVNFKNLEALEPVCKVVNEANEALKDTSRTIVESAIPEVLGGVAGAGAGVGVSFLALYGLGTVGLSAAGITSGLAAAGALVGGGMVAGVGVLAAPVAILAVAGYGILSSIRNKKLKEVKERIYQEAIKARDAIICELEKTEESNEERIKYLNTLNTLLQHAIRDLQSDLAHV